MLKGYFVYMAINRKGKVKIEELISTKINDSLLAEISKGLSRQIKKEEFNKVYVPAKQILKLAGAGVFLAASIAIPKLPKALKPFYNNKKDDYEVWKRFNIPYMKRTLKRFENQKLVEIAEENNIQIVKITEAGKRKILKYAIDSLVIEKPKHWDGRWRLISYDIPGNMSVLRDAFREHLKAWRFYPLHESAFLHAYPCEKQVEFLRAYLGVGEYIRIFTVSKIENDKPFRDFFGV